MTKHPVADAFAHLAAMMHECDVAELPRLVFKTKEDHQRVLRALQNEVGGDPAHFDALAVISMDPSFYGIEFGYEKRTSNALERITEKRTRSGA